MKIAKVFLITSKKELEYDWSCEGPGLGNCSRIPSFVPSVDDKDYKFIRKTFFIKKAIHDQEQSWGCG